MTGQAAAAPVIAIITEFLSPALGWYVLDVLWCQLGFPLSRDFFDFQVPGLLDFFSPGTTGPRDLQGL